MIVTLERSEYENLLTRISRQEEEIRALRRRVSCLLSQIHEWETGSDAIGLDDREVEGVHPYGCNCEELCNAPPGPTFICEEPERICGPCERPACEHPGSVACDRLEIVDNSTVAPITRQEYSDLRRECYYMTSRIEAMSRDIGTLRKRIFNLEQVE